MKTRSWFILVCAVIILAGCARPPSPRLDNIYRGLSEDLPRLDPDLLAGRRIAVDPGHGGRFAGTRGQDGLEESMVNLGVSLYLWGLLREAGAETYLTRSADRDFIAGADSSAATDLQVRVDMVDSTRPDILVSIHHNAQPSRDPKTNSVETYYKLGDPASRDLAFAVHRHLARNLGIAEGDVRAGNYYVLRGVDVPAILGEASYLTHPNVEGKLRLSEKQRLEAEAYFLGILEYFSRGTPVVEETEPPPGDSVLTAVPRLSYAVTDVGGIGIDPGGIDMLVNGVPARPSLDPAGRTVSYALPWDSPNGSYDVSLVVRNLRGNSSRRSSRTFSLELPAARCVFSSCPEGVPANGGTVYIRARLLDERGLSVADGSRVEVAAWHRASSKAVWTSQATTGDAGVSEAVIVDGVAEFPLDIPAGSVETRVAVTPRGQPAGAPTRGGETTPVRFEHTIPASTGAATEVLSIVLMDGLTRIPIDDARFFTRNGLVPAEQFSGRFVLPGDVAKNDSVWIEAPGYRPFMVGPDAPDSLYLDPWFEGRLAAKRVVINPEGRVGADLGRGRLGLSGSHVGLLVARHLQEYLEAAGALVEPARVTEETPVDRDIVILTNRFRADLYIEIRYRTEPPGGSLAVRTYHFPGSQRGFAVAKAVGEALGQILGIPFQAPIDTVTFPLQQTACPAIILEPPSIGGVEEELRAAEPWYQRKQAYGIFCGLLRHAGADSLAALNVHVAADSGGSSSKAVSNWLVTVDDTWRLLTSPEGVASFALLPPGAHRVILRRGEESMGPADLVLRPGEERVFTARVQSPR